MTQTSSSNHNEAHQQRSSSSYSAEVHLHPEAVDQQPVQPPPPPPVSGISWIGQLFGTRAVRVSDNNNNNTISSNTSSPARMAGGGSGGVGVIPPEAQSGETTTTTTTTTSPVLHLECQSWNRDSHELYDYESHNYYSKQYLIKSAVRVFRSLVEVSVKTDGEAFPQHGDFLLSVKQKDNKFWVYPAERIPSSPPTLSPRKVWLITKYLRDQRYPLSEGDVMKLGRFKLKIKQIVAEPSPDGAPPPGVDYRLDGVDIPITELSEEEAATTQCRICLLEGAEENDPLIRACQCKGSIMYVHLECLRHWVNGRLNLTDDPNRTCCFIRQIPCELCKATFPQSVSYGGVKMPIVKVPKIEPPFIVLENLVGYMNKGVHLCSLAAKKECKLGRGHESDVRIADVSISRWHATIRFVDGQFQLHDQRSKFGTLVALRREVPIEDDLCVQVGRTVLKFSLLPDPPALHNDVVRYSEIDFGRDNNRSNTQPPPPPPPPEEDNNGQQQPPPPPPPPPAGGPVNNATSASGIHLPIRPPIGGGSASLLPPNRMAPPIQDASAPCGTRRNNNGIPGMVPPQQVTSSPGGLNMDELRVAYNHHHYRGVDTNNNSHHSPHDESHSTLPPLVATEAQQQQPQSLK